MFQHLKHRATVERSTETMVNGTPVKTWAVIAVRVPCLYSKDATEFDPMWTVTQRKEAGQRGTLFAVPKANILPGDRLTITRPSLPGKFEVQPDNADITTPLAVHHKEFKVKSV